MTEASALTFDCEGEELIGLLHSGESKTGVVVVVGGPQYRVGSHRQFLLLARSLSAAGIPVLRFDCRGMGDSSGSFPGFEYLETDIRAAVDCLTTHAPQVRQVILGGICDAASAILMYAHTDERIAGVTILNPWIRSETGLARTQVRHYYLRRFFQGQFWQRLLTGKVPIGDALGGFLNKLRQGSRRATTDGPADPSDFIQRMQAGLQRFQGSVLCILSGQDITAAEFSDLIKAKEWRDLMARPGIRIERLAQANHTFATAGDRARVEALTLQWLNSLGGQDKGIDSP
jgi:exosortase A-associated hydrolase 1